MNRRNFFKFLPIAPVAFVAEGAKAVTAEGAPLPGDHTLSLQGYKRQTVKSNNCMAFYMPVADPNKVVSITVGQDGKLWVKSKDSEWARVVTE